MKPIYCAESQERIPPEYFKLGKAIWSGGKASLKVHSDHIDLKAYPAPPKGFEETMGGAPAKAPAPAAAPAPAPAAKSSPESVMVGSTIHGPTSPVKNPLLASTVAPP